MPEENCKSDGRKTKVSTGGEGGKVKENKSNLLIQPGEKAHGEKEEDANDLIFALQITPLERQDKKKKFDRIDGQEEFRDAKKNGTGMSSDFALDIGMRSEVRIWEPISA